MLDETESVDLITCAYDSASFKDVECSGLTGVRGMDTAERLLGDPRVGETRAVVYRKDIEWLYVIECGQTGGRITIFDGKRHVLIKTCEVSPRSISCSYDQLTRYLYVTERVEDDGISCYSILSIIDTTLGEKVGKIKIGSYTSLQCISDVLGSIACE